MRKVQLISGGSIIWIIGFLIIPAIQSFSQVILTYDNSIPVINNNNAMEDPWAGGINAGQYGRIDLDGDEQEDLIIYERSSNMLNTYLHKDGKYQYNPDFRAFLPESIEGWILIRDFDCDGAKDIFTFSTGGMKVFRNLSKPGNPPEWELVADPVYTLGSSGIINLQVNITDVPAIQDIDGDGDLDVLVYNFAIGGYIRFHRNLSVENTGSCGTLDFELVTRNWGFFEECDCQLYAFQEYGEDCETISGRVMHPGGKSLLLIDMDNDGDMDFLGGHEQCDEFYYLENTGTSQEAKMIHFTDTFPSQASPSNFPTFPAGFYDDFDDDGINDLIVSPNTEYNLDRLVDFNQSSWFYKNNGSNELPKFDFVSSSFLQSEMIDIGENATPLLVDEDGDGDLDILIGGNGVKRDQVFFGGLTLFENTGSPTNPSYKFITSDYKGFSSIERYNFMPLAADLNQDGAMDLVLVSTDPSNSSIETRWYVNPGSTGSGIRPIENYQILDINLKAKDSPFFTDVNNDGLNDLLIGKLTGRLEYYENIGNDDNPNFLLTDTTFLDIDDSYIEFKKNLVPFVMDLDLDGNDDLLTTDYTGTLTIYRHYKINPEKQERIILNEELMVNKTSVLGYHTWMTGGLIAGYKSPMLLLGTIHGGIIPYKNIADNSIGESNQVTLSIYPNPLQNSNNLTVRSNSDGHLFLFNNLGQLLENPLPVSANRNLHLEIGYLPQGLYIFKIIDSAGRSDVKKLVRY